MEYGQRLNVIHKSRDLVETFYGMKDAPGCAENQFSAMHDMTLDRFPHVSPRERRLLVELTRTENRPRDTVVEDPVLVETTEEAYEGEQVEGPVTIDTEVTVNSYPDQRPLINVGTSGMVDNPGYGYPITETVTTETYKTYEYSEDLVSGEVIRKVSTYTRVTRTYTAVVRATDPHSFKFNGEHTFFIDRDMIGGRPYYRPVMDGEMFSDVVFDGSEHEVVMYGAYFVVFPEMWYVNSVNRDERGYVGDTMQATAVYLSDVNGNELEQIPIIGEYFEPNNEMTDDNGEPLKPGQLWLADVGAGSVIYKWNGAAWEPGVSYLTIEVDGNANLLVVGDYLDITAEGHKIMYETNTLGLIGHVQVQNIIREAGQPTKIVIKGITRALEEGEVIDPEYLELGVYVPRMDWVFEAGGRLWACRYGEQVNGEFVNEIFCTKARSFSQWLCFTGAADGGPLATDSFVFNVSEAGDFTGACLYNGMPTFFKKDVMYRVSGTTSSGFSLYSDSVPGVQAGSGLSLCIGGGILYYKGSTGVYAYSGSMPVRISDDLGARIKRDAVGGTYGRKLVMFMKERDERWIYVFDTLMNAWTRESVDEDVIGMTELDDMLLVQTVSGFFGLSSHEEKIREYPGISVNGLETAVEWEGWTGLMGLGSTGKKYVSRFEVRFRLPVGCVMGIDVEYDTNGKREQVLRVDGREGIETMEATVRLRRCDHFRLRLWGRGECEIMTISKVVEGGTARNG